MLRAMRTLFVCALLALTAARAAADCDPKDTRQLYVKAERGMKPQSDAPPPPSLAILTSGAWTRAGQGGGSDTKGCLSDARKKMIDAAVTAAQFKTNTKAKRCRVAPTKHVVYAAPQRKLHVEHDEPCGVPFDPATAAMIACADAVVDAKVADDAAAKTCKP